ncbi:hypothetical protein [Dyadobacter soli]|uniref:hypothetical protein n=1 Tax=Dyadobacter soli TaxID=659014 RepID=UPI000B7D2F83|nr:hypothetical protein [Dyadobacter soli]
MKYKILFKAFKTAILWVAMLIAPIDLMIWITGVQLSTFAKDILVWGVLAVFLMFLLISGWIELKKNGPY